MLIFWSFLLCVCCGVLCMCWVGLVGLDFPFVLGKTGGCSVSVLVLGCLREERVGGWLLVCLFVSGIF